MTEPVTLHGYWRSGVAYTRVFRDLRRGEQVHDRSRHDPALTHRPARQSDYNAKSETVLSRRFCAAIRNDAFGAP
jgi:hypothetical protein